MSSKQNDRHIIWSDIHLDFEDWRADLEEQYPDLSEDELIQKMYEINSDYLGDERMNLNVQLSQPILVVADIGRWDGRYDGYAEIKTGNIKEELKTKTARLNELNALLNVDKRENEIVGGEPDEGDEEPTPKSKDRER